MRVDFDIYVDRLLDMNPDPIPKFVLLKEFKKYDQSSAEYQNAYDRVCGHPFVKAIEESQNERGFWPPFHGFSEHMICKCLAYGLDGDHICLGRAADYLTKVLNKQESTDHYEKQDHPRWWPDLFEPLFCAAMLSLIRPRHEDVTEHRNHWASFANAACASGLYLRSAERDAQNKFFGFFTTRTISMYGYYNLILMAPDGEASSISDETDRVLVDYCMHEAPGIYYVYNNILYDPIPIGTARKDSRDFCHWIRALSLVSQFKGWASYEDSYFQWVLSQSNYDGLWELPKRHEMACLPLSDSWRSKKNKVIDSSIMILRFLKKGRAY